jgi:hypothetical protein
MDERRAGTTNPFTGRITGDLHPACTHQSPCRDFPISASAGNFWGLGEFGVVVFFVISGFLITGLLLDEIQRPVGSGSAISTSGARSGFFRRITHSSR